MGVAKAHGKLLLFGEHAAVYGHPAVGLALPWSLAATHTQGRVWELPGLGSHEVPVLRLLDRLSALSAELGLPPPCPGRLEFTTAIPVGSGFGSSAALCAALVNLFFPTLSLPQKDQLAWKAEGLFHGTSSGIDTALALRLGWWALDPSSRPVTATPLPDPGLTLVTGALVRMADTKTLVGEIARRKADGDVVVNSALESLGHYSRQAIALLRDQQPQGLGVLVNQAREKLRTLGLEPPPLTQVLDAGLGCPGAVGGKLSGAGGGGAFFLVFEAPDQANEALTRIEAAADPQHWTSPPRLV